MSWRKSISVFTWKAGRSDKWLVPVRIALSVTLFGHRQLLADRDPLWPVSICLTYNRIWIRCLCHLKVIRRQTHLNMWSFAETLLMLSKLNYNACVFHKQDVFDKLSWSSVVRPICSPKLSWLGGPAPRIVDHLCRQSQPFLRPLFNTSHTHIKCTCYSRQMIIRMLIKFKITLMRVEINGILYREIMNKGTGDW